MRFMPKRFYYFSKVHSIAEWFCEVACKNVARPSQRCLRGDFARGLFSFGCIEFVLFLLLVNSL
jgi:hypothetical protein